MVWQMVVQMIFCTFFVANVNVNSGELKVNVNRFSNDNVWNASNRNRVVVPQLTNFSYQMLVGVLFCNLFSIPFFQPPSILPISFSFSEISAYLSVGISLLSHAS